MGSLEKVTTGEALQKWADDVRKRLDSDEPVAYVIEPKIDGSAVSLVYENGRFVRGATRGDGFRGRGDHGQPADDQVDPARAPASPGEAPPPVVEVRGEVYFPLSGFQELNERLVVGGKEDGPESTQRSSRNSCGSSTRRSRPSGRSRSGSTAPAIGRASRSRRSGSCSSGCASAAFARTRSRPATSRSRRSRRPARPGSRGGSSSTTRSTGS